MALELNIISFIGLLLFSRGSTFGRMKYFLIQAVASGRFLWRALLFLREYSRQGALFFIVLTLLVKLGSAPVHWWFIGILADLRWDKIFVLSTLQKVLPLMAIRVAGGFKFQGLVVLACFVRVGGSWSLIFLKQIIGYSSIFMLGWVFSVVKRFFSWITYLRIYSISLFIPVLFFYRLNMNNLMELRDKSFSIKRKVALFFTIINMGGVPPLFGFWGKVVILAKLGKEEEIFLSLVLLLASVFITYLYARVALLSLFKSTSSLELKGSWKEKGLLGAGVGLLRLRVRRTVLFV